MAGQGKWPGRANGRAEQMIVGTGLDTIDIRRIERCLDRFGERFMMRVFTPGERARSLRRFSPAASFAKRFAAKEAAAKALGTGIAHGIAWRDIEVVNLPTGQPVIRFHRAAAQRLDMLTPPGFAACTSVSMSDEPPLAQAMVIVWAAPEKGPGSLPGENAQPAP